MATASRTHPARHLPYVLLATFAVAIAPLLTVYALERYGIVTSAFAATGVGVVLSVVLARAGAWLWMRHSASMDLVFGDLMLWGWLKRARNEKRMSDAMLLLGFDRTGTRVRAVDLPAKRQGEILRELAASLEHGDPFTHGHTRRVTRYADALAKTMRLPKGMQTKIRTAAAVHDVGKIDVPADILNKPGRLTDEEFNVMKRHSARGAEMVERLGDPEVTAFVRHHHERIDGRGYPDNLKGEDIPLGARVIAVADTFDAIISTRPYRAARAHKEAIEILKRAAGTQLDEDVVHSFLAYYSGRKPLAWWLSVSTGVQRVLGGFGGWLQHAKAGSVAHGATSLGATIALTTAMATVAPNLGVGRHDGPALPDGRKRAVVVAAGDLDPSGGAAAVEAPDLPVPGPGHLEGESRIGAGAPTELGEVGSQNGNAAVAIAEAGSSDASDAFVAAAGLADDDPTVAVVEHPGPVPVVEDDDGDVGADDGGDPGVEPPGRGSGPEPPKDSDGKGRGKCDEPDPDVIVVLSAGSASDDGPAARVDKDKSKHKSNECNGPADDRGKDDDNDTPGPGNGNGPGNDNDTPGPGNGDGKGNGPGNGNGKGNGNGNGNGNEDDVDPADPADPVDDDDDSDTDSGEGADSDAGGDEDVPVDPGAATDADVPAETDAVVDPVTTSTTPDAAAAGEDSGSAPGSDAGSPGAEATLPAEESAEDV